MMYYPLRVGFFVAYYWFLMWLKIIYEMISNQLKIDPIVNNKDNGLVMSL